jgi:mono/diheme cytochrome c family protein
MNQPLFSLLSSVCLTAAFSSLCMAQAGGGTAAGSAEMRSSMRGVYTAEQATRGTDTYASICASCHTISEMTGTNFSKKWVGFPLWDLYSYLAETMPQSDPGSLSPREYAQVVAYILNLNGQPAGKVELPADTAALKGIKVDTIPVPLDTARKLMPPSLLRPVHPRR